MSEIMQARAVMAKKLNVMVRKIEGITTFVLAGNDEYTPDEIFFVVASSDDSLRSKAFADLDFLIRQFLRPFDIQKNEENGRTMANYLFDNGLKAQVNVCSEQNLPYFNWWVPFLDKNGAALSNYSSASKKPSDPTTERPQAGMEPSDVLKDELNEAPAVQPAKPEPVIPAPAPEPKPEPHPEPRRRCP